MVRRLGLIALLVSGLHLMLSCTGGQPSEEEVTRGGEGKRQEVEAKFVEVRDQVRPAAADPILLAEGAKQYARKCAFCHGSDGMKRIPLAQESAHRVTGFAPDDIAVQIQSGVNIHGKVRNHKQFRTLKGAELYATILYVQNLFLRGAGENEWVDWKARLALGDSLFQQHCASCHVQDGPDWRFSREYLLTHSPHHLMESGGMIPAHAEADLAGLSEQDRWTIAYWLQSLLYELPD